MSGIEIAAVGPLFIATRECLQNLERCTTIHTLQSASWAEDRLAEFQFWIASLGVLAPYKASLASRLRIAGEDDIYGAILQLLKLLNDQLKLCISNAGQRSLIETGTVRNETATDIELATQDVVFIQEQLTHLAVAIRRSGSKSRTLKADRTFDPSQHVDLRSHLTILILLHRSPQKIEQIRRQLSAAVSGSPQPIWPPGETLDKVQSRLVNANLRRRHRFVYAQSHASKLEREGRPLNHPLAVSQSEQIASKSQIEQPTTISSPAKVFKGAGNAFQQPKDTLTDTTASEINVPVQSQMPTRTPSQKSRTVISTTTSKIGHPAPPELRPGTNIFRCPCCCLPHLSEVALQPVKWRNHIAKDVQPYTCVLESCPQPDMMYVTRNAWVEHMNNDHTGLDVWECMLCGLSTQFYSLESLESHLTSQHPGALKDTRAFADACLTTSALLIVSCPLCTWAEDQTEPIDTETLIDHIAEHVHSFSLRSLPWASTINKACGEEDTEPDAEIENWISTVAHNEKDLSLPQEPVPLPDQIIEADSQDVIEYVNASLNQALGRFSQSSGGIHEFEGDYFAKNLYFGEDNQDSIVASAQLDDDFSMPTTSRRSSFEFRRTEAGRASIRTKWSYLAFKTAKTRAKQLFWISQWLQSAMMLPSNEYDWSRYRLFWRFGGNRIQMQYLARRVRENRARGAFAAKWPRSDEQKMYEYYMARWIVSVCRTPRSYIVDREYLVNLIHNRYLRRLMRRFRAAGTLGARWRETYGPSLYLHYMARWVISFFRTPNSELVDRETYSGFLMRNCILRRLMRRARWQVEEAVNSQEALHTYEARWNECRFLNILSPFDFWEFRQIPAYQQFMNRLKEGDQYRV